MRQLCDDLVREHLDLDAMVGGLDEAGWSTPTPAAGWSIRDQISHLWFFDQRAHLAITDPVAFAADMQTLLAAGGTEASVVPGRAITGSDLLSNWRVGRELLVTVARGLDPSSRVPWYGPAMGARSFITARLMETWAHGQDVADALGISRQPSDRLRHVAHIGVGARRFSYAIRNMPLPDVAIEVVLAGPRGEEWRWGEPSANRVSGPALDFCLAVTQRRHVDDTQLVIEGDAAREWMSIAQAYAGEPGPGRPRS